MTERSTIEVGSRWRDKDYREVGRVVEVEEARPVTEICDCVVVEAAPGKQHTIGRRNQIRQRTLERRYELLPNPRQEAGR